MRVRTCSREGHQGVTAKNVHESLEFATLDITEFLSLPDLQLLDLPQPGQLHVCLLLLERQLGLLQYLPSLRLQLRYLHLRLTDDVQFLCFRPGFSLGLPGVLNGLDLGLKVVELPTLLLSEGQVLDLSLLQGCLRLLLVLVCLLLRLRFLHLRGDLDGQGH